MGLIFRDSVDKCPFCNGAITTGKPVTKTLDYEEQRTLRDKKIVRTPFCCTVCNKTFSRVEEYSLTSRSYVDANGHWVL